ncbi:MAG TPA: hypothetical protein VK797_07435 [Tepidisphaeraceae bacterium]|nr:hypothetical protein [Tepidisphaeraceae bacterium]
MNRKTLFVAGLILGFVVGCASYYRVTDPSTGKVYYTTELKQDSGATTLKDGRTGDMVTVQNVEVRKISKEDYEVGRMTPPAAPVAAAPAPVAGAPAAAAAGAAAPAAAAPPTTAPSK